MVAVVFVLSWQFYVVKPTMITSGTDFGVDVCNCAFVLALLVSVFVGGIGRWLAVDVVATSSLCWQIPTYSEHLCTEIQIGNGDSQIALPWRVVKAESGHKNSVLLV
jgi:hypothetical protein